MTLDTLGKGLLKSLQGVFKKSKRYGGFPLRITKWWMRCLKQSEAKAEEEVKNSSATDVVKLRMDRINYYFREMWKHTKSHYSSGACKADCPCDYLPYYSSLSKKKRGEEA